MGQFETAEVESNGVLLIGSVLVVNDFVVSNNNIVYMFEHVVCIKDRCFHIQKLEAFSCCGVACMLSLISVSLQPEIATI